MRPARPRPAFRGELPATQIVREHAAEGGADPRRLAAALYREALILLDGCADHPCAAPFPEDGDAAIRSLARNALALFPVSLDEGTAGALTPEWLEEFHRLSRPDADHKRHGRWYTARPIARFMARRAFEAAAGGRPMDSVTVLDPACGCGALLVPAFEALVAFQAERAPERPLSEVVAHALSHIVAADVDARALETAVLRLKLAAERMAGGPVAAEPRMFCGNTLAAPPSDLAPDGADIVVMNPPYLGNRYFEALPDPEKARAELRKVFGWNDDLYTHFLHLAWDWLRPGGALCAITSDTFLTIPSKARTRDTLRRHRLREIVRVPASAFAAAVNTCITLATRETPGLFDTLLYLDARDAPEAAWERLEDNPPPAGAARFCVPAQVYAGPETPFFRPTPRAIALFERFLTGVGSRESAIGSDSRLPTHDSLLVPLGNVAAARDCGINSGNVRAKLFFTEYAEGRDRLIQGRQIERYIVRWDSLAAQYRWVDVHYQPDPGTPGMGRGGKVSAHGETWGFRGELSVHAEPERLFLRQTEDDLFAAYLRQDPARPTYTDNTLFTLVLNERGRELGLTYPYLLGLLNSAFLNELYHALSQEKGRAQAQVKVSPVNRLPIVIPNREQRVEVEEWVCQAMAAAEEGRPLTAIQWQLDSIVESLYGAHDLPPREAP